MQITIEWLRAQRACYITPHATGAQRAILTLLPASGAPLADVLRCDAVPPADRVWVAARALPAELRRRWLGRIVRRALSRVENPDPRSADVLSYLDAAHAHAHVAAAAAAAAHAHAHAHVAAAAAAGRESEREAQVADALAVLHG